MSRSLRLFTCSLLSLFILPAISFAEITNSSNELVVESFRLEPDPQSCSTTLYVTVRNNASQATYSGLFMRPSQYRSLGGTLRRSSMLPGLRVPVTAPGQATEEQIVFVREPDKTNLEFRFQIGADTVAQADGPLPAFADTYAGAIVSHRLDTAAGRVEGTIRNTGNTAIPKPLILLSVARRSDPATLAPSGSDWLGECLLPGATVTFKLQVTDPGTIAAYQLRFLAGGTAKLDEKNSGRAPAKTKELLRPKLRLDKRPLLPPR